MFPLHSLWWGFFFFLNHEWMLNFVKSFFCVCWNNHMTFVFYSADMTHYINWFSNTEPTLHGWNKSCLVMSYNPFHTLWSYLLLTYWIFVHLCSCEIWSVVFSSCSVFLWFGYWGNTGLRKSYEFHLLISERDCRELV